MARVRAEASSLAIGVRLSLFDSVLWHKVRDHGEPLPFADALPYDCGFGVEADDPTRIECAEPIRLLEELRDAGVAAVNFSAGSPFTVPHVTRPAAFPPSDGYPPPEDPLVGVWRQIEAAARAKAAVPGIVMVGSGYTYLQEYVAHAAQAAVCTGLIDIVGLGRMVLSYPQPPADALAKKNAHAKPDLPDVQRLYTPPRATDSVAAAIRSTTFTSSSSRWRRSLPEAAAGSWNRWHSWCACGGLPWSLLRRGRHS